MDRGRELYQLHTRPHRRPHPRIEEIAVNTSAVAASRSLRPWLVLAAWILLCFAATAPAALWPPAEWYAALNKPEWNPPSWVFGPVWTTLYTMMAVSAWLVWRQGGFARQWLALSAFLVQLALNALWSPLFFGLKQLGVAFAEIIVLWLAIACTIVVFRRVHRTAAWLLVPYLAWVSFAAFLNWTLWRLNA
jgi:benzodiazapine receptor